MSHRFTRIENADLKASGATHRAVVTGFATGFEAACFFVLKEVDEFGDGSFFDTETFETWMTRIHSS